MTNLQEEEQTSRFRMPRLGGRTNGIASWTRRVTGLCFGMLIGMAVFWLAFDWVGWSRDFYSTFVNDHQMARAISMRVFLIVGLALVFLGLSLAILRTIKLTGWFRAFGWLMIDCLTAVVLALTSISLLSGHLDAPGAGSFAWVAALRYLSFVVLFYATLRAGARWDFLTLKEFRIGPADVK